MKKSLLSFAFREWLLSFGRHPPGIGAEDFYSLTRIIFVAYLLIFIGLSAWSTIPKRIEQTLLGAIEQGERPIRLTRDWRKSSEVSARALLHLSRDPRLSNVRIVPQRELDLLAGSIALPIPFENRVEIGSIADGEQPEPGFSFQGSISGLALGEESPIWSWVEESKQASSQPSSSCTNGYFDRGVIGNQTLFDTLLPPSLGAYDAYRTAILQVDQNQVFTKYLPESIESWSELSHILLTIKEVYKKELYPTVYPHKVDWRRGLPLPETSALLIRLSYAEAVQAAVSRSERLSFAPEGCGSPVSRYRQIIGDVDDSDTDELQLGVQNIMDALASCFGVPLSGSAEQSWSLSAHKPNKPNSLWLHEDVANCLQLANIPEVLEQTSESGPASRILLESSIKGQQIQIPQRDDGPLHGVLETRCTSMREPDYNLAITMGHASVATCYDEDGAVSGSNDPLGLLTLRSYDNISFVPINQPSSGVLDRLWGWAVSGFHRSRERPKDLVEFLLDWTPQDARDNSTTGPRQMAFFDPDNLTPRALTEIQKWQDLFEDKWPDSDKTAVFEVDQGYSKALVQFSLTDRMVSVILALLALVGTLALSFMFQAKAKGVFEHRLGQYSLFVSYGFSRGDLFLMLFLQIILCLVVAAAFGLLAGIVILGLCNWLVAFSGDLLSRIYETLGFDFDSLFETPTSSQLMTSYILASLGFLLMTWVVLKDLKITWFKYPADLVNRDSNSRSVSSKTKAGT